MIIVLHILNSPVETLHQHHDTSHQQLWSDDVSDNHWPRHAPLLLQSRDCRIMVLICCPCYIITSIIRYHHQETLLYASKKGQPRLHDLIIDSWSAWDWAVFIVLSCMQRENVQPDIVSFLLESDFDPNKLEQPVWDWSLVTRTESSSTRRFYAPIFLLHNICKQRAVICSGPSTSISMIFIPFDIQCISWARPLWCSLSCNHLTLH